MALCLCEDPVLQQRSTPRLAVCLLSAPRDLTVLAGDSGRQGWGGGLLRTDEASLQARRASQTGVGLLLTSTRPQMLPLCTFSLSLSDVSLSVPPCLSVSVSLSLLWLSRHPGIGWADEQM